MGNTQEQVGHISRKKEINKQKKMLEIKKYYSRNEEFLDWSRQESSYDQGKKSLSLKVGQEISKIDVEKEQY